MQAPAGKFRLALVFPPYGPPELANLGLAALSAGVKARGLECQTFYWNYRFADALPYATIEERRRVYTLLTQRDLFPWTEWAFTRSAFPDELEVHDKEVQRRLAALDARLEQATRPLLPSALVFFICNNAQKFIAEMADQLADFDIVGIGTTFFQNAAAVSLAKHIKQRWPRKIVVLGGANCDGEMGRGLFENFPFIDYVFSGEVDNSFPEFVDRLANGRNAEDVPGILFRCEDGSVGQGPPAVPIDDMNALPVPDFDDYIAERRRLGRTGDELCLPLESSRGCWWGAKHHCVFCGLNANGMAYRQKDQQRFKKEVREIIDRYGARYLFMADNILSLKYFKDFVQWAKNEDLKIDFFYEIKANLGRQQIADLADAGITMVQPGIESFSSSTLRLMQKGVRGIQNVAFLKYASEYGILTTYNILAGFPGEDPYEYEKMAREIPKFSHLAPPNGVIDIEIHRFSPLHNNPEAFGIQLVPHENYSFIYPLSREELAKVAYRFEIVGRFPFDLSYLANVTTAVQEWTRQYRREGCVLTWKREGSEIAIQDRRPMFGPRDYRLKQHAVAIFEALDAPTSVSVATAKSVELSNCAATAIGAQDVMKRRPDAPDEIEISFSRDQFLADPDACIDRLISPGLVYADEGLYVTLPIHVSRRSPEDGWKRLAI